MLDWIEEQTTLDLTGTRQVAQQHASTSALDFHRLHFIGASSSEEQAAIDKAARQAAVDLPGATLLGVERRDQQAVVKVKYGDAVRFIRAMDRALDPRQGIGVSYHRRRFGPHGLERQWSAPERFELPRTAPPYRHVFLAPAGTDADIETVADTRVTT